MNGTGPCRPAFLLNGFGQRKDDGCSGCHCIFKGIRTHLYRIIFMMATMAEEIP